ncbi:unnamed protein product [Bursaphelenchus okinawaensis]|uniref:Uncharacterized protein n=1 Tax=Bursaphelenchus okinawaensis TaxID=465554 RepID=A0A811KGS5_9BILA|nr:unnamed protein product [Bursaphelenchus okinawaensis]CAG9103003.1 unnamed protein product [Bursaphelenchus okinawaensis]
MANVAEAAGYPEEAKKSYEYTAKMEEETRRLGKVAGKDVEDQLQCLRKVICSMDITKAGLESFIRKLDVFQVEVGGPQEEYDKLWNSHKKVLRRMAEKLPRKN